MNINNYLKNLSKTKIYLLSIIITFLIGAIDYYSGNEVSVAVLYLLSLIIVSWYGEKRYAIYLSVISALLWLYADIQEIARYSNQAIPFWNAFVRLGIFLIVAIITINFKKLNENLETIVKDRTAELENEIAEREKAEINLRQNRDKLRQLAIRIQNIREEENRMIAREIHDELGQALTALKIEIAWLVKKNSGNTEIVKGLDPSLNIVDDTIKTVRKISTKLRPRLLDELGLLSAVRFQLKDLEQHSEIEIIPVLPVEDLNLDQNISTAYFRIFQEAITNMSRHSKATELYVMIKQSDNSLLMKIKDNGIGATQEMLSNINSLGVLNMRERAMEIGANFNLKSEPGAGTEINVELNLSD